MNKTILLLLTLTVTLSQSYFPRMMQEGNDHSCCPTGSLPYLKPDYIPKGEESSLEDLPIYTIGNGTKAIIFAYDIYGFDGGRTRAMCDQFADAGYLVILPDFFRGDYSGKSEEFTGFAWLEQYPWEKINDDLTRHVYPYLESKGVEKIGMLGTCWGAWVVFSASAGDKLSAGVSFHPSLSRGGKTPDMLSEAVTCPQMVLAAGNDPAEVKEGGSVEAILKAKPFGDKVVVKNFEEQSHGWVPRGDLSQPNVERDVKLAMDMAIEFFNDNLENENNEENEINEENNEESL